VPHAVEYGQNHGLPANSRRNIVEGSIELETLHGEEHGIIGSGDFAGRDELGMQRGVAVRARDAQPLLCRSRWPDEKGYVPPGLSKPPSQIATVEPAPTTSRRMVLVPLLEISVLGEAHTRRQHVGVGHVSRRAVLSATARQAPAYSRSAFAKALVRRSINDKLWTSATVGSSS
jgi:hypothetical protein